MNTSRNLISLLVLSTMLTSRLMAQGGFTAFSDPSQALAPEDKTVRPITGPYFHEDSFITTGVRAWYVNHEFDSDTIGGDVTVMALQVRVALTETLQFVAYKDGYTEFSDAAVLENNDGWNDIGAGLKWAFLQDWEKAFHMAAGIGYELGLGDEEVLQDTDELRFWLSANKAFDLLHLGSTVNYIIAMDDDEGLAGNGDMVTVHLHADYYLNAFISPVVEINGYLAQDDAGPFPFSGVDAVSLPGGNNEDTWTGAIGVELRPLEDTPLGIRAAFETELTDNISLFGDRITLSATMEF